MAATSSMITIVNDAAARLRFSPEAKKRCYAVLMPNVYSNMEPYVPYREGGLTRSLNPAKLDEGTLIWNAPYAGAVWRMPASYNWTRTRHPLAGPEWGKRCEAVYKESWRNMIAQSYNGK